MSVQTDQASCRTGQGLLFAPQHRANSLRYTAEYTIPAGAGAQAGWAFCPGDTVHKPQRRSAYVLDHAAPAIPALDKAYRAHNGAWGRLGPLVGFPVQNQDGSVTQNTALGKLTVRDETASTPVAAQSQYLVSVSLQAIRCFGTLARGPGGRDALYVIVSLAPFGLNTTADAAYSTPVTVRTAIVNARQGQTTLQNVPIGDVVPGGAGVHIHISLWQHKAGDPDKIRDAIHQRFDDVVNKASNVALAAAGNPGGTLGDLAPELAANTGQSFADRLIAEHTYHLALENVLALADPTTRARSKYADPDLAPGVLLNWPPTTLSNPLLGDDGALYRAYFDVTTTVVPMPMF